MKLIVKKSKRIIFKLVILSVIMYILFAFVNQYVRLKKQNEKLSTLNEQILIEKGKNKEVLNMLKKIETEEKLQDPDGKSYSGSGNKIRVFENIIK